MTCDQVPQNMSPLLDVRVWKRNGELCMRSPSPHLVQLDTGPRPGRKSARNQTTTCFGPQADRLRQTSLDHQAPFDRRHPHTLAHAHTHAPRPNTPPNLPNLPNLPNAVPTGCNSRSLKGQVQRKLPQSMIPFRGPKTQICITRA